MHPESCFAISCLVNTKKCHPGNSPQLLKAKYTRPCSYPQVMEIGKINSAHFAIPNQKLVQQLSRWHPKPWPPLCISWSAQPPYPFFKLPCSAFKFQRVCNWRWVVRHQKIWNRLTQAGQHTTASFENVYCVAVAFWCSPKNAIWRAWILLSLWKENKPKFSGKCKKWAFFSELCRSTWSSLMLITSLPLREGESALHPLSIWPWILMSCNLLAKLINGCIELCTLGVSMFS